MAVTETIHPDLADDPEFSASSATATAPVEAKAEAEPAAPSPQTESAEGEQSETAETPATETQEPPAWWNEVKDAPSPKDALRLLTKNLPRDEVARDETLAGLIGDLGAKQGRRLFEDWKRQESERAARAPIDKAVQDEDVITLGEAKLREERERQAREADTTNRASTYGEIHSAISEWAGSLPEPVVSKLAGKQYDGDYKDGLVAYVNDLAEGLTTHRIEAEIAKRMPAINAAAEKAALSRINGGGPSPEIGTGQAGAGVRVITDEEISAMDLDTYDQYFDEHGRPRGGVQYKATRAVATTHR